MLNQAFSIIDTIIAGKIFGENGIAAIGSTVQIITLLSCAFSGYAVGFSVLIAKLLGAKDYEKVRDNIYTTLLFIGAITVIVGVFLGTMSGKVAEILRIDEAVRLDAQKYFAVYASGFVLISLNHLGNYIT